MTGEPVILPKQRTIRDVADLARRIDHTLLRADARARDIHVLCDEAQQAGLYAVCVNPCHIETAARKLRSGSRANAVQICAAVGFPLGANCTPTKVEETRRAIEDGADEIDMVMAIGRLKQGDSGAVLDEIGAVVNVSPNRCVKVIIETTLLDLPELDLACDLAKQGGAGFVKTSTGFGPGGATVSAVARIRSRVGPDMGIKASGGIRNAKTALDLLAAGADRLGASASMQILSEWGELRARDRPE